MQFHAKPLPIAGLLQILPETVMHQHGWVSAVHNDAKLGAIGIHDRFVDDRIIYLDKKGTVRGLRYQVHPAEQALLLRPMRGKLFVAAVDLRRGSPTFGRSASLTLDYMAGNQLYATAGFAIGWCSLEPATEFLLKASADHNPDLLRGIDWRDPTLKIEWPVRAVDAVILPEDVDQPQLAEQTDLPG